MGRKKDIQMPEKALLIAISNLIEQSKSQVVAQVNSTMTLLFYQVGNRINEFVLDHKRVEYGKQIVVTLSRQLEKSTGVILQKRICGNPQLIPVGPKTTNSVC